MLESLTSLLALAVMLLAAYGSGRPVVRRLRYEADDLLAGSVWSIALGFVLAGVALMALGLAGCLYRPLVGVLTYCAAFWAIGEVRLAWMTWQGRKTPAIDDVIAPSPPLWLARGLLILSVLTAIGTLMGALAPATDGDALCYHLELPKQFLTQHAIFCPSFSEQATFPLLTEMWYLWALMLDGPVAAQLIHWALGIVLALASILLSETILGRSWAWLAGAVVILLPGVSNQMTAALNDAALAAFTTLALAALLRSLVDEDSQRWLLMAGVFLGAALGIKYTALLFAVALAALWLWLLVRQPGRRWSHLQGAGIVVVIAAAIAGPWYLRAAWHRGNPVYPFFSQQLGASGPNALPKHKTPLGWSAASLASLPWQVTMHAEHFGGRGHQFGPMFLLVLPGLLVVRRLRGLGLLLSVALLYTLLWYALRQNMRFLYPIAPLLAAAVVWFWMEMRRLPAAPRLAAGGMFAGVALLGAVAPIEHSWHRASVALGWQSREEFLREHEPCYAAAEAANALLEPGDHILSQDYRTFYFDVPVTREAIFRRATQYDRDLENPADLAGLLRRAGFSHLLLAEATGQGIRYNSRLSKLVEAARQQEPDAYRDLIDYQFRDCDGSLRRYRLVGIAAADVP